MTRFWIRSSAGALLMLLGAPPGVAGTWEIAPYLRAEALYTDNALLEESAAQADVITTLVPGVRITQQSRHFSGSFDGYVNQVMYRNNSAYDDHYGSMRVSGNAQATENLFGLDGRVAFEERRNQEGVASVSRVLKGEREQVRNYSASPYLNLSLGPSVKFSARHAIFYQRHETRVDLNKNQAATILSVMSDRQGRLDWWAEGAKRETDYVYTNDQLTALTLNAGVSYLLNETWRLGGAAGTETYEFTRFPDRDFDSTTWQAQAQWAMTPRTRLALSYGHRFYGNAYSVDFTMRNPSSTLTFGYSEETIDQQYNRVQSDALAPDSLLSDLNQFIVNRTARGTAEFTLAKRLRLAFYGFAREREDVESDKKEWEAQERAVFTYTLGPRTNAILSQRAGRTWKRLSGYRNDRYRVYEMSLVRTVSKTISIDAGVSAANMDSTDLTKEYEELAARLGLKAEF